MITTLIMDADGVLINGEKFSEVLRRDFPVDADAEKEFFTTAFQDCLVGKADLKQSITPYLPSFGWKGTADEFLTYWFRAEHKINADLMQDIQSLRTLGIRCVLATNQERYRTRYMMEHMGFGGAFDRIYSSAHLGLKKPAVDFFERVLQEEQVEPGQVLFWDDDPRNINGAREAGIHAEFYTSYEDFRRVMAESYGLLTANL